MTGKRANSVTVRALLEEALRAEGKRPPRGARQDELEAFSAHTGIAVPEPLAVWLRMANGVTLPSRLYGIASSQRRRDSDIEELYDHYPEWKARGWIPIAEDGCGNYYLMPTRQEFGPGWPVFFVEAVISAEEPAYLVASNIWAFLTRYMEESMSEDYCSDWLYEKSSALMRDPDLENFTGLAMPWDAD